MDTCTSMEHNRAFAIEAVQSVLVAVAVFLLVRQLLLLPLSKTNRRLETRQLPPGPRGLPLLGSLLSFSMCIPPSDALLKAWTQQYGPLFTVRLGVVPFIFVGGRAQVKEMLLGAGGRFDSRPFRASKVMLSNNPRSINSSPYNARWRELRKNLSLRVMGPLRLAALAPVRSAQLDKLVARLKEQIAMAELDNGPGATLLVTVRELIRWLAFHMLVYVVFGTTLEEEKVRSIDNFSQKVFELTGRPNIGDFIPMLAPLVNRAHNRRLLALRSDFEKIILPLVAQIRYSRLAGTPVAPSSYVDSLVELEGRGVVESDDYVVLCSELLNAGTDTTSGASEFAMAELVKAPEMQAKLAAQIASACCGDQQQEQPLDPSRFDAVPLLRAVVLETLRIHSPAAFSLPHQSLQDDAVSGYAVPKNSQLLACIYQLGMDPEVWPSPHDFRPERFLDGPSVDITGSKGDITMIPFGAGRRICPGMGFALAHMQHVIGRFAQEFEWLPSDDAQPVDLTHLQHLTVKMKYPLHARIRARRTPISSTS